MQNNNNFKIQSKFQYLTVWRNDISSSIKFEVLAYKSSIVSYKLVFFSISEQHEISLVHCAMVGSQKSRSCLGAELVSQLSKFLKNRGSTRNSNHSTKSFVFSSQNISEHLTTSWYISFVLFCFVSFFLIYLRSSVKLEFLKAS